MIHPGTSTSERLPIVVARLALLLAIAMVTVLVALFLAERSAKYLVALAGLVGIGLAGLWIRDMRAAFLFALPIAVSYNRQYYSFEEVTGDWGAAGLYWVPADAVVVLLLIITLAAALIGAGPRRQHLGVGIEPALMLFIAAATLSTIGSKELPPSLFEVLRLMKLFLIVILLRVLLDDRAAWALLAGLAATVLIQAALGALQFALGAGGAGLSDLSRQGGELARRATGTLGHPNFLAPFLLTIVPGFFTMAIGARPRHFQLAGLVIAIAGVGVVVLSQSRAPILALAVALAAAALELTVRGFLSPRRLIGAGLIAVLGLSIAAAPVSTKIAERLTGDFSESIDFRIQYNQAAVSMWRGAPILGVGPNQFIAELDRYEPVLASINDQLETYRKEANARAAAPVHNLYLLILAETGAAGFVGFLLLLVSAGVLFRAAGAARRRDPLILFFSGVFWGYLAVLFQQTTDFSLWWDHHLYLFIILCCLALVARAHARKPDR